jgi:hypothetical protein
LIDEESLLKEITFLKLRPNQTSAATEPVSQKLLERLKIMDDIRFVFFLHIRVLWAKKHCCGTVMIYCGSGSYFGKILIAHPAPVQVPDPVPVPDPYLFNTVFNNKKFVQNLAFSVLEAALFPRSWHLIFVSHFMLYLEPEPKCITLFCNVLYERK